MEAFLLSVIVVLLSALVAMEARRGEGIRATPQPAQDEAEISSDTVPLPEIRSVPEPRSEVPAEPEDSGLFTLDRMGRVKFADQETANFLGRSRMEIVGKHIHDVLHGSAEGTASHPREICAVSGIVGAGIARHVTHDVFWTKDGSSRFAEYFVNPVLDGEVRTGALVVFHDLGQAAAPSSSATGERPQRRLVLLPEAIDEPVRSRRAT